MQEENFVLKSSTTNKPVLIIPAADSDHDLEPRENLANSILGDTCNKTSDQKKDKEASTIDTNDIPTKDTDIQTDDTSTYQTDILIDDPNEENQINDTVNSINESTKDTDISIKEPINNDDIKTEGEMETTRDVQYTSASPGCSYKEQIHPETEVEPQKESPHIVTESKSQFFDEDMSDEKKEDEPIASPSVQTRQQKKRKRGRPPKKKGGRRPKRQDQYNLRPRKKRTYTYNRW